MTLCLAFRQSRKTFWPAIGTFAKFSTSKELGVTDALNSFADNTFLRETTKNSETESLAPDKDSRAVLHGHYVRVSPTPLSSPTLVSYSKDMVRNLLLSCEQVNSEEFVQVFSGNTELLHNISWATPYAVSVMGQPILSPDRYNGNGYGDGRAITIGEYLIERDGEKMRWDLQLKGAGRTPFSRSFDGRSVLRSSVREFLVSEAMHHLGVPTTRSLCLIVSDEDVVDRAWYESSNGSSEVDNSQYSMTPYPPNVAIREKCAITTRVSPSFIRIGHIELFARRILNGDSIARTELETLLRHTMKRDFPFVGTGYEMDEKEGKTKSIEADDLLEMLSLFSERMVDLVVAWKRVGYVQGNMNSDNCLLCGRTLDYGPFGFMEQYQPKWTPFTSDPASNFGFENQDLAGQVNLITFAQALNIFVNDEGFTAKTKKIVMEDFPVYYLKQRSLMRKSKLGLIEWKSEYDESLWKSLMKILIHFDFTIFFRQLSNSYSVSCVKKTTEELLEPLSKAICAGHLTNSDERNQVADWLRHWLTEVESQNLQAPLKETMLQTNPKYIPREWMLVQAYTDAEAGNFETLKSLQNLFETPYDEHMDKSDQYFIQSPEEFKGKPGVAFYS